MTKTKKSAETGLGLSRAILSLLLGLVTWIILAYIQKPDGYSPLISLIVVILVSNSSERKYLTLSGTLIGMVVGLVMGLNTLVQSLPEINLLSIFVGTFAVGLSMITLGAGGAFMGFVVASFARLYKQGVIF